MVERGIARLGERAACAASDVAMHCGVSICGACYEVGPEVVEAVTGELAAGPRGLDLRAEIGVELVRPRLARLEQRPPARNRQRVGPRHREILARQVQTRERAAQLGGGERALLAARGDELPRPRGFERGLRLLQLGDLACRAAARGSGVKRPAPPGKGRGQGFGFARYKNLAAYCAVACEVAVDLDSGRVRLVRAVAAVDSVVPVRAVLSIDEMDCELTGRWSEPASALPMLTAWSSTPAPGIFVRGSRPI